MSIVCFEGRVGRSGKKLELFIKDQPPLPKGKKLKMTLVLGSMAWRGTMNTVSPSNQPFFHTTVDSELGERKTMTEILRDHGLVAGNTPKFQFTPPNELRLIEEPECRHSTSPTASPEAKPITGRLPDADVQHDGAISELGVAGERHEVAQGLSGWGTADRQAELVGMQIAHMNRFIASAKEEVAIASAFTSHDIALDFQNTSPTNLAHLPTTPGIYSIVGRRGGELLKVYVGKAKNIQVRIGNYHRSFQVHCPNDRKLAMFQEWLAEADPGWSLSVCTTAEHLLEGGNEGRQLAVTETKWINALGPFVNCRRHHDPESRARVEQAFTQFFRSFFTRRLDDT